MAGGVLKFEKTVPYTNICASHCLLHFFGYLKYSSLQLLLHSSPPMVNNLRKLCIFMFWTIRHHILFSIVNGAKCSLLSIKWQIKSICQKKKKKHVNCILVTLISLCGSHHQVFHHFKLHVKSLSLLNFSAAGHTSHASAQKLKHCTQDM